MTVQALTSEEAFVAGGTSLRGYIETTRSHIESVFGAPSYDVISADDKVTTEWVLVFTSDDEDEKDIIATIYDWKRYEMGKPQSDEKIIWNIGGNSFESADKVAKELGVERH